MNPAAKPTFNTAASSLYTPTKVDRVLHDGDEVKLGGTVLVAHLTPGHTKGCTTWTMKVTDGGKTYNVVIIGSPNVNAGYKLVNNAAYPQIARRLRAHLARSEILAVRHFPRRPRQLFRPGRKVSPPQRRRPNPFIDPDGYKKYIAQKEQDFYAELAKQKSGAAK